MPPIQLYVGIFFGALAAIFLLLAFGRSKSTGERTQPVKAFVRIGLIFAAVSLSLLVSTRYRQ